MGCGRVGARVATELDADGHSVAVIDKQTSAFERLGEDFSGQRVTGDGFRNSTLEKAGIVGAYAFAAVTNGDNSNIIAARTVREVYHVDRVVTRIYDPDRAELYERMGIPTVAAVMRTSTAVLKRLLPPSVTEIWQDSTGTVSMIQIRPADAWLGYSIGGIERLTRTRIPFVVRMAGTVVAQTNLVLQEYDVLLVAVKSPEVAALRRQLSRAPEEGVR